MRNFEIVNFVFKRRKFEPESPNLSAKQSLPRAYKRLERVLAASSLAESNLLSYFHRAARAQTAFYGLHLIVSDGLY